ncbi:MAG: hypothetical protein J7L96_06310 [Bacteroidales bacterium]|nr:hypothetical protein [Bacteroidales bacterium]
MEEQIIYKIVNRIKDDLTVALIDNVASNDELRADVVKVGRFQENPIKNNVYVAINGGNKDDIDYKDGFTTMSGGSEETAFYMAPREIGGGSYWWRRGMVDYGLYFVKSNHLEEESMKLAYAFLGRLTKAFEKIKISDLVDDYGERGLKLILTNTTFFETGGPKTKYIWRGKLYWSALTNR